MIWECSGKYSTTVPCTNPVFSDHDYHTAWQRLCTKLRKYTDETVLSCRELFVFAGEYLVDGEVMHLRNSEEDYSRRKYVLCSLCLEGCITTEKLFSLQSEIDSKLEEIKKHLTVLNGSMTKRVDELDKLYMLLKDSTSENLEEKILLRSVTDGKTIEFELIGGLSFKEELG